MIIGNGPYIGSAGQQVTGSIQEDLFIQGKSFSFEDYFIFGDSEIMNIIVNPTNFTGANLTVNPIIISSSSGPITLDLFYDADSNDDGTYLSASNRRFGMSPPATTLMQNPTNITDGTRFAGDLVPATGNNPSTSTGGGNERGLPFELSPAIKYLMRLTNIDGAGTYVQIKLTWFEV